MNTYLRSTREGIDAAVDGLPLEVLARARDGRWSIAEILEHLTLAFRANTAALEKALASGELRARAPVLKQRLARMMVVDLGYFPRVEAPEITRPSASIAPAESVTAIREALAALDDTLTRVAARFGEHALVANHPYFAGMTVPQWRKFHWRHTMHHMAQVRARAAAVAAGVRS